jgi:arylmalonate decarboxylase
MRGEQDNAMNHSRREFLRAGCAFALAAGQPRGGEPAALGLILPAAAAVPAEALAMYPAGVRFVTESLSKPGDAPLVGTLATYERLQDRIVPAARALVDKGADAIVLLTTSVTFYKGAAHNQNLIESIQSATKRPATTMSSAIVEALRAVGSKRVAVASGSAKRVESYRPRSLRGRRCSSCPEA